MKYIRVENGNDFKRITTVDAEHYESVAVWPDGFISSQYKATWPEMGWSGLKEFLKHKGHNFTRCEQCV